MKKHQYWTYILTDEPRTVLYTGFTNNLSARLIQHWRGSEKAWTTKYQAYFLVYYEETRYINNAIQREKEIKDLSRQRKEELINTINPTGVF